MRRFKYEMFRIIEHGLLAAGEASPEHKYYGSIFFVDFTDHGVGKIFPAFSLMGSGCMCADRKNSIQKENSLLSPFYEITVIRNITAEFVVKLLIYILKRRRRINSGFTEKDSP